MPTGIGPEVSRQKQMCNEWGPRPQWTTTVSAPEAALAALPFEDLMKRWPMNSWWRFSWTGEQLAKKLSNWRDELSKLCLDTDAELLKSLATKKLKSNKLSKLLVRELLALVGCRVAKDTLDLFRYTE